MPEGFNIFLNLQQIYYPQPVEAETSSSSESRPKHRFAKQWYENSSANSPLKEGQKDANAATSSDPAIEALATNANPTSGCERVANPPLADSDNPEASEV